MQRNYPVDILREKAQAEEYLLLWSLFDCSFHVSSYATCAHTGCRMQGVDRPSKKNKEQVHWWSPSRRGTSLSNEWSPESLSLSSFCKCDTLQGNLQAVAEVTPFTSPTALSADPLHNLLSHAQAGASGVTGGSGAEKREKELNGMTWVIFKPFGFWTPFHFLFFFEDTCQLGSLIHWELLIQPSKLGVFWLQLQLLILLSVAHMIFSLLFFPLW